jgi:ParB family chromosome partitioning protein
MKVAGSRFDEQASLPLADDTTPAHGSLEGRRRLGGALYIARERIRPDPDQPRRQFDTEAQKELNDSVKRLGILQPITVRFIEGENLYRIITGERRYHAACESQLAEIPCWVQSPKEDEILLHQIVENWQRLDMHPYDLADALARLRDAKHYSQQDLAHETGKSKGEISKLFAILDLDPAVQKLAREDRTGHITRRHLYAVRSLPAKDQVTLIRVVQDNAMTAEDLEHQVTKRLEPSHDRSRRGAPVNQHRFSTSHASITMTFRKKDVSTEDILTALDEVRLQVNPPTGNSSIHS